jgi:hypothetical protein
VGYDTPGNRTGQGEVMDDARSRAEAYGDEAYRDALEEFVALVREELDGGLPPLPEDKEKR